MLMRGSGPAGRLRGAVIAAGVILVAIAGSWLIPGLAWRGLSAMEPPRPSRATPRPGARAPAIPGMQIRRPRGGHPRRAQLTLESAHRPAGAGAHHRDRGGAVAQPAGYPLAGGRVGAHAAGAVRDLRAAHARGPGALPLARRPRHRASWATRTSARSSSSASWASRTRASASSSPSSSCRRSSSSAPCSRSSTISASCSSWCVGSRW